MAAETLLQAGPSVEQAERPARGLRLLSALTMHRHTLSMSQGVAGMRRAACLLLVLLLGAQAATPTGRWAPQRQAEHCAINWRTHVKALELCTIPALFSPAACCLASSLPCRRMLW